MHLKAQVESGAYAWGDGIEGVGQDAACSQRSGNLWKQCLAKCGEVGMCEGCLEFTSAETQGRTNGIVNPCLLQHIATRCCGIDTDVVIDLTECLTGETDDGIGNGKATVGNVILIIGFVKSLVVVVFHVERTLHIHIGLEHEIAILRLKGEATVVGNGQHAVLHIHFASGVVGTLSVGVGSKFAVVFYIFCLGKSTC